jgi:hypothetical protein
MGYPQLLHIYPAEEIPSARGLHQKRWKRFLWRRESGHRHGWPPLQAVLYPALMAQSQDTVAQNE